MNVVYQVLYMYDCKSHMRICTSTARNQVLVWSLQRDLLYKANTPDEYKLSIRDYINMTAKHT